MGCCISIFRPTRHSIQQSNNNNNINNINVQDKLVISQNPPKTTPISSKKLSPISPLSPTISSSSSVSSFFSTNSNHSVSSCSSSSLSSVPPSSSILSSRDRSFSNEFLWSCVKENPHIVRINSIKEASQLLLSPKPKPNSNRTSPPPELMMKHSISSTPTRLNSTTPHKRIRSNNSPINRQKSFREEHEYHSSYFNRGGLKSPSPSRRFSSGDYYSRRTSANSRVVNSNKVLNPAVINSPVKKENLIRRHHNHHNVNREKCIQRVKSRRIDEVAVEEEEEEEVAKHHDIDDSVLPLEDIDNPLISFDCFIFL